MMRHKFFIIKNITSYIDPPFAAFNLVLSSKDALESLLSFDGIHKLLRSIFDI